MQMNPNKDTQLCISLSGRPGNFGLRFHNHLYEQLGLNFYYKACSSKDLAGAVTGIRALGIRGCGVSMPFKEACIELVDELDASARAIASINTIVNTDGHSRPTTPTTSPLPSCWTAIKYPRTPPLPCVAAAVWPRPWLRHCVMVDIAMA